MSNPKPYFPTVIKTSVPPITKHPRNVTPNSSCTTNQGRITFKPYLTKTYLLSLLHSIYNSIKLSNQSSLNFNKRRKTTNKLPHTSTENTSTSSKTRITSNRTISVNFNPAWWRKLSSNKKRKKNFTTMSINTKIWITLKSNILFFIKALDEFLTRHVKSLILIQLWFFY